MEETDLDQVVMQIDKLATRRMQALRKAELATDILRKTVVDAVRGGLVSQSEAARLAGVRRQTVIEWMGKK